MLDLRRMEILQRFSVCGSIAATAASLGYSPSAISQQLATLEREVGAVLLERTARSAALTDAGRLLAGHAADLLAAAERAQADLAAQVGRIAGQVLVSTIPSLATTLAAAVSELQRRHPRLAVVLRQTRADRAADDVADHLGDIAVVDDWEAGPGAVPTGAVPTGVASRPICAEPVVLAVYAAHPLAGLTGPVLDSDLRPALAETTWLCAPPGYPSRVAGDRLLDSAGAVPARRWEFEGLTTIADLVAGGTGCGLLPASVARAHPSRRLVPISLEPPMVRHIEAISRTSAASDPATVRCLDAITEYLRAARRPGRSDQLAGVAG